MGYIEMGFMNDVEHGQSQAPTVTEVKEWVDWTASWRW